MTVAVCPTPVHSPRHIYFKRWSYPGMGVLMIGISIAGFAPAIVNPAIRRAPMSLLAALHGLVFFAWLALFLVQSLLIATRRVGWHQRLGIASVFLLALMIPLGYLTTMEMARRGFDLSGDQKLDPLPKPGGLDAKTASLFNLAALLIFTLFATSALWLRRRPSLHKRLMLFANIELMGAPITHLLGHIGLLTPPAVIVGFALLPLTAVVTEYVMDRRSHPMTVALGILTTALLPIEGALIGPSTSWRHLIEWMTAGT